jgi:hypothetical protein
MKVVYVYADNPKEWNSSEWRCAVPARAVNRTHLHSAALLSLDEFARCTPAAQAACEPADVLIVQRNLLGPVLAAVQHWRARDKVVIADFDDAYQLMPPSNAGYSYWFQGLVHNTGADGKVNQHRIDPLPLTQFRWGLRLVDGATVPSRRLADDWRSFTDIRYVPNYIELEKYLNVTRQPHEGVILGWGGSISHLQSFTGSGVVAALRRVCTARPQVKVMICGSDRRVLEALSLPAGQIIHKPWIPYCEWAEHLSQFDIGLAPLHGEYDERRSWIKVLEYMVMKIPWVASEGPAYDELRPYGWLVKNTASAWERVLLDMIDHLEDHKAEAGGDPYFYGISQSIDDNIDRVLETYLSIGGQAAGGHLGAVDLHERAVPAGGRP